MWDGADRIAEWTMYISYLPSVTRAGIRLVLADSSRSLSVPPAHATGGWSARMVFLFQPALSTSITISVTLSAAP
jgi:hypothetical protein